MWKCGTDVEVLCDFVEETITQYTPTYFIATNENKDNEAL